MEREEFFDKIKVLDDLNKMPNAWDRLAAITKSWPQDMGKRTSSTGGNSKMFALVDGKVQECQAKNVTEHTLCNDDFTLPAIVIYPYGIVDLTTEGVPIFEDPAIASMRSIALEDTSQWSSSSQHWLEMQAEPLFNIDKSGAVFARYTDAPTVDELVLLDNILEQFEAADSAKNCNSF